MKASKLIVLLGLMVLPVFAFGQTKSIDVMETVKVNREVSTHFVTGDPIKYVDISMNEVGGNLPLKNILRIKPIEEKIKVKNNRGGWGEEDRTFIDGQSMGIVTIVTERSVSQYQLVYTEIPQDACSQYVIREKQLPEPGCVHVRDGDGEVLLDCLELQGELSRRAHQEGQDVVQTEQHLYH